MTENTVQISIPFDSLLEAINTLSMEYKVRIWDMIEEQIIELEEKDPRFQAQIAQALADYRAGNYITLEEYLAESQEKA